MRLIDLEDLRELFDILGRGLRLPIEDGSDGDFITADGFADVGESEIFLDFGVEEGLGLGREAGR